jgi:enoyl-CoA hydratase
VLPEASWTRGAGARERVALLPANQLQMMKLLVNQASSRWACRDPADRHAPRRRGAPHAEGVAFSRAAAADVRRAVAERDAPFGDYGQERG